MIEEMEWLNLLVVTLWRLSYYWKSYAILQKPIFPKAELAYKKRSKDCKKRSEDYKKHSVPSEKHNVLPKNAMRWFKNTSKEFEINIWNFFGPKNGDEVIDDE